MNGSTITHAVAQRLSVRPVLHHLYKRLCIVSMTGSMMALLSPDIARQSPYDRLYKRLCTVSTNGSASSLQLALRRLYNRPYIAHTTVYMDVFTIISAIVYNGSTNGSANGSTIAHTIVRTNGSINDYNSSTADLQQLYGGSTAALQQFYSGSTVIPQQLCNGSSNGFATAP
jgi:hypothetical protein